MCKLIFYNFLILISLLTIVNGANYMEVPQSFIVPCNLTMPNLNDCMRKQTQSLFNQISSKGIPGLKSLRPIDPYFINRMKFNQGNGNIVFKNTLTNIKITGLKDIKVEKSILKYKDYKTMWYGEFLMPKLHFDLDYEIDGRILLVPIKGNGRMFLEMDNVKAKLFANTFLYERYGHVFCNFTDVNGDITGITGLRTELQNLFNGNKELEQSTNQFFNENWREIFEIMKPLAKHTIEGIIHDVIKKIYAYVPANFFIQDLPIPPSNV